MNKIPQINFELKPTFGQSEVRDKKFIVPTWTPVKFQTAESPQKMSINSYIQQKSIHSFEDGEILSQQSPLRPKSPLILSKNKCVGVSMRPVYLVEDQNLPQRLSMAQSMQHVNRMEAREQQVSSQTLRKFLGSVNLQFEINDKIKTYSEKNYFETKKDLFQFKKFINAALFNRLAEINHNESKVKLEENLEIELRKFQKLGRDFYNEIERRNFNDEQELKEALISKSNPFYEMRDFEISLGDDPIICQCNFSIYSRNFYLRQISSIMKDYVKSEFSHISFIDATYYYFNPKKRQNHSASSSSKSSEKPSPPQTAPKQSFRNYYPQSWPVREDQRQAKLTKYPLKKQHHLKKYYEKNEQFVNEMFWNAKPIPLAYMNQKANQQDRFESNDSRPSYKEYRNSQQRILKKRERKYTDKIKTKVQRSTAYSSEETMYRSPRRTFKSVRRRASSSKPREEIQTVKQQECKPELVIKPKQPLIPPATQPSPKAPTPQHQEKVTTVQQNVYNFYDSIQTALRLNLYQMQQQRQPQISPQPAVTGNYEDDALQKQIQETQKSLQNRNQRKIQNYKREKENRLNLFDDDNDFINRERQQPQMQQRGAMIRQTTQINMQQFDLPPKISPLKQIDLDKERKNRDDQSKQQNQFTDRDFLRDLTKSF